MVALVVRCTIAVTVLFGAYVLAPLEPSAVRHVALRLVASLVLFIGVIVWQVLSIMRSDRPRLRAVEAVVICLASLVVIFASIYVAIGSGDASAFSEPLDHADGIYFTVTVLATVGFGDITPVSTTARSVTTVQMLVDLAVIGVLARLLFGAARKTAARQDDGTGAA